MNKEREDRAEEKKKLENEIAALKDAANDKLDKFLQSSALITLAMNIAAPAMKNGLYGLAQALGNHYPFRPEEIDLQVVPTAAPDLKGYSWDEEKDIMLTPEGRTVENPTNVFPDLANLTVKYPWKPEEWPEEYADGGDDDDEEEGEGGEKGDGDDAEK